MNDLEALKVRLVDAHHRYDVALDNFDYGCEYGDINDQGQVEADLADAAEDFDFELREIEEEVAKLTAHERLEWNFWIEERRAQLTGSNT